MKKNKKLTKKQVILLVIGILVVLALIAAIVKSFMVEPETSGEYDTTEYATAEIMDVDNSISANGEIVSGLEEDLTPHAGYKLKEVNVEENEEIMEGETILTYTNGKRMTAPYNCVVKKWKLPNLKGEIKNSNSVTIAGTSVLNINLSVTEEEVLKVKEGYEATVKVKATGNKYKGYVSFVSDVGDYSDGSSSFEVKVSFDNDGKIKLGMNGTAKISLGSAKNVLAVPVNAVYTDGEYYYVSVVDGEVEEGVAPETREVKVVTGLQGKEYIEIMNGLSEGQTVVVNQSDDQEEEWY